MNNLPIVTMLASCLFCSQAAPQSVFLVGSYDTPGSARGVFVAGDYAYVSCWDSGLVVVNVSDPANPSLAGGIETSPGHAWDAHLQGEYAYIADDYLGGLMIADISDPVQPVIVGCYDTPGWAYNLEVDGNYVYMADGHTGYFQIIDVSDPTNPAPVADVNTNGWARGISLSWPYIYLANGGGLRIFDISNPAEPRLISNCITPPTAFAVCVAGNYAFLIDNHNAADFLTIDVSVADSARIVHSYALPSAAWDVFVRGHYAFIANYESGLRVLDISDPLSPELVGLYDTPGRCRHVYVDKFIYVADDSSLLILVFDPTDVYGDEEVPHRFGLFQNYPNPFNAQTTISYALPQKGPVTLSIYSLLGQKLATLFEGVQEAGEYKVVWDAPSAPSGVYFYRLEVNEYVETRKMVLLR